MKSGIWIFLLIIGELLWGCSTHDSFLVEEEEVIDNSAQAEQENRENNQWIFTQMKHHYLWNTEIPDSILLDFTVEPESFFQSLLSPKDRFSWCEVNRDYATTRATNAGSTVSFDSVYVFNERRIGYAIYDQFDDNADVRSFVVRMKNAEVEDMILDLRYNPGGYGSTCMELASFFVPQEFYGKLFMQLEYNDILTKERIEKYHDSGREMIYLRSGSWFEMWGLNLKRLFVLTSEYTASASEMLIMGLRPYMEVVVIGETTVGKDVGSYTIADNNYKYQLQPITVKYYNALMEATPTTGIVPDVYVANDRKEKRGEKDEPLLSVALQYIESHPLD